MPRTAQKNENQEKNSNPVIAPDRARSESTLRYPAIAGVTISNGIRFIAAVEDAVNRDILSIPKRERRSILTMFKTTLRLSQRGLVELTHRLEKEGEL